MKFAMALPLLLFSGLAQAREWQTLDDFSAPQRWRALASDQVKASLRPIEGPDGKALCLDYDFGGVSGYAVMRRELQTVHPAWFEYDFQLCGDAPLNNLEIKLPDASGDNVWWVSRPNWPIPREWTPLRLKERHFSFAWGPRAERTLRETQHFELTISAGRDGGKGSVCLADLRFRERAAPSPAPPPVRATAADGSDASAAVDGDLHTSWMGDESGWPLTLDLAEQREFGGLVLRWAPPLLLHGPGLVFDYRVDISNDGHGWTLAREVRGSKGKTDFLALPESEARWLRISPLDDGPLPTLHEAEVKSLTFAATPNDFIAHVAATGPRGVWPRGFYNEQPYWTLVGIDGGREQGLIGEDGAIELYRGGPSIEPFLALGGDWLGWADVTSTQSLQDGYLPIPTVRWTAERFTVDITAYARGTPERSQLFGSYRITNSSNIKLTTRLALVLRPLQVNGPRQFLSTPGGVSPVYELSVARERMTVAGTERVRALAPADRVAAASFDAGGALAAGQSDNAGVVHDDTGLASGAWFYDIELEPGDSREIAWIAPLTGKLPAGPIDPAAARAEVAAWWRESLNHARFKLPAQGQRLIDSLRTALAHMLVSRVGPRLQPGTRSYARAWIRDGVMIGEGLLRLGRDDVAAEFLDWYVPYQFDSGKVPCCVDARGADPVPENDSHGQLVHGIAELYRYTGDRAALARYWPNVQAAVRYMDQLRVSERTAANRAKNAAFYGLMPASISHEGYSAKPMHSYWDDFWALRGYKDAVEIAGWLGHGAEQRAFAGSRDAFRADLHASLVIATRQHGIDFLPGAAELGDFDATSTTIALSPGDEQAQLPQDLLANTFERYWREFTGRRDGTREWDFYTPYELRTVGSFVRLGRRDRAHAALDYFLADQAPRGWNQWAEVVSRTPRAPFFLGDLPHAWVGSDYVRSVLDMFAFEREGTLVLAAGVPADWLVDEGIAVTGLRTAYGTLDYALASEDGRLRFTLAPGVSPPLGTRLSWPYAEPPGETRINGQPAHWQQGELRLPPGRVEVIVESSPRG
jgi:hypothetical protein